MINTEQGIYDYYENEAETSYESLNWYNRFLERRRSEIIIDLLNVNSISDVLDVGCGEGIMLNKIHSINNRVALYGIDISPTRISRALANISASLKVCSVTNISGLPLKHKYSNVICSEVLEHLPNPELALRNIYDVMLDGGKLIISIPYDEKLSYYRCINCGKITTTGHIQSFNENRITGLLASVGFNVEYVKGCKVIPIPIIERYLSYKTWSRILKLLSWYYRNVRPYYLVAVGSK